MISANGVEYKNVPEQVQYLTEQVADIWNAIAGINPPDLTLYALKTYVDAADSALGTRITAVESSIGTLLTKTEAANTYAKIADIGTYINLSDYVKTVDMYTYVQSEIQNFDLDSNTDFTALKSRVSTLEASVSSMTSDIADANATAANAQTAAGNAVNTANNASAVATNAYNTATSAASDVADMQTTINNYDSRIDAVESTVAGFQASLTTAQNTANAALAKAESALSMIAGLHSLTKQEEEFEGDSVTVAGFVEGSLCTLTKLEGDTKASDNLIKSLGTNRTYTVSGLTWTITGGTATVVGTYEGATSIQKITIPEFTLPAGTYYLKAFTGGSFNAVNGLSLNPGYNYFGYADTGKTLTLTEDTTFSNIGLYLINGTEYNITLKPMIVKGSTAPTEFIAGYDGLKSVSISGLSSGGGVVITTSEGTTSLVPTLDYDTLELRAYDYLDQTISGTNIITSLVRGSGIVDLGTLSWTYNTASAIAPYFQSSSLAGLIKPNDNASSELSNVICGKYTNVLRTGATFLDKCYCIDGYLIKIKDLSYTDVQTFKTAMSGVYLVYELATQVTTVLATVTYTDVSVFFEAGAAITVNNANTQYDVESTSTMYGYVAE